MRNMGYRIYLLLLYALNWLVFANTSNEKELLLCRRCGADVANSYFLFSNISPGALKIEKQNLFGRKNITVQTLINPHGVKFDIITIHSARCEYVGMSQVADSWFPGYTWYICICPYCGQLLGWSFESQNSQSADGDIGHVHSFYGLILDNLLGKNFTDSLIIMPKMYKM